MDAWKHFTVTQNVQLLKIVLNCRNKLNKKRRKENAATKVYFHSLFYLTIVFLINRWVFSFSIYQSCLHTFPWRLYWVWVYNNLMFLLVFPPNTKIISFLDYLSFCFVFLNMFYSNFFFMDTYFFLYICKGNNIFLIFRKKIMKNLNKKVSN